MTTLTTTSTSTASSAKENYQSEDQQTVILDERTEAKIKKAELKAERVEAQARRANARAEKAATYAGTAERNARSSFYKAEIETKKAELCNLQAKKESEASEKHSLLEAEAATKKKLAQSEAAKSRPKRAIADAKKSELKSVKAKTKSLRAGNCSEARTKAREEVKKAETEFKQADLEAQQMESIAREANQDACRAKSEAKKARLEVEQAFAALESEKKHVEAASLAVSQAEFYQEEAKGKRAEAEARRAEAESKRAEAAAWRAGDQAAVIAHRAKASGYKQQALDKDAEMRARRAKSKTDAKERAKANTLPGASSPPDYKKAKRESRSAMKKHLSAPGMLKTVREVFQKIPDPQQDPIKPGPESKISLSDCLMSGLAMFSLKYPSLLQFDNDVKKEFANKESLETPVQEEGSVCHNLKTLYGVEKIPCDTYLRQRLDLVDPTTLQLAYKKILSSLQRGKELEQYAFYEGYYLIAGDGTGYFSSNAIHCENCCEKHHKNGKTSYYHQMMGGVILNPDHSTVIPFCPEPIIKADGSTKNDCERNASSRLYKRIRREHPHLPIIITEDALGSNGPHIKLLQEMNMRFILVVKPDGNKFIFDFLKGVEREKLVYADAEFNYEIQFVNNIPLNDSHKDLSVNFLEVWVYDKDGKQQYHNTWITDIEITKDNGYRLYQGGRAKWKIENETFNTLKNQGYRFEHNFGHGKKNLSTIMAFLMCLAFLIDQVQQSCCGLFQAAWERAGSKLMLWDNMRTCFKAYFIESWEQLWKGIAFGIRGADLVPIQDTS